MGCRMIHFTSDTHFSDPRILRIDRRPFASLAEHDEALVAYWNEVVAEDDQVWHLGDFTRLARNDVEVLLARLRGRKNLVIGNNDGAETTAAKGWESVQHYAELEFDGRLYVLCHYPFRTWNRMGDKSVNLHGHSHGKLKAFTRQYDVGVDVWNFRPVALPVLQRAAAGRRRTTPGDRASGS